MKVKELIQETIWKPSTHYTAFSPRISVLLPTYCRGKSGYFKKTVSSILSQTFVDFELIIVDDASVDGTQEQIKVFMEQDERISCLIHKHNIGLPAISEYEAFLKARGDYIIFAFDDFIFEPHAFYSLYEAIHGSGYSFCHGLAKLHYLNADNMVDYLLFGEDSIEKIFHSNTIANASIIVKKEVFYQVGLYDPNLAITRACDWDLWIRITKEYAVKRVNIVIGSEHGAITKDSLGQTYYNNLDIVREYITNQRNHLLLPNTFHEFEFDRPLFHTCSYTHFYYQEVLHFYRHKQWAKHALKGISLKDCQPLTVIFYGQITNYILCFNYLHHFPDRYKIKYLSPSHSLADTFQLQGADIIIIDRMLHHSVELLRLLEQCNVSIYYFIDDNFVELRKENPGLYGWYTLENLRNTLQSVRTVLVSTEALKNYFTKYKLHKNVICHPPTLDNSLLKNLTDNHLQLNSGLKKQSLIITIVGGEFRKSATLLHVVPVLDLLQTEIPITLYARKGFLPTRKHNTFEYLEFDVHLNYYQFIHSLKQLNIDIIIHPTGKTFNLPYKTNSILLTALYLNANLIVTDEPAFTGMTEEDGIVKCENTQEGYMRAINFLRQKKNADALKQKLKKYCLQHFLPSERIRAFDLASQGLVRKTWLEVQNRNFTLTHFLTKKIDQLENTIFHLQNTAVHVKPLKTNLPLIAFAFRFVRFPLIFKRMIYLKLFFRRFFVRYDLASDIQAAFNDLLKYSIEHGLRKMNYYLTVSHPIKTGGREYTITLPQKTISIIKLAFEHNQSFVKGSIGIEIRIHKNRTMRVVRETCTIDFNLPVFFKFDPISLSKETRAKIRIFSQQLHSPIRVYEFRKKGFQLGKKRELFCSIA